MLVLDGFCVEVGGPHDLIHAPRASRANLLVEDFIHCVSHARFISLKPFSFILPLFQGCFSVE